MNSVMNGDNVFVHQTTFSSLCAPS